MDERAGGFRHLPSVERVLNELQAGTNDIVTGAARLAVDKARDRIRAGEAPPSLEDIVAAAAQILEDQARSRLQLVINATGVLVHTNLGRAPLGAVQLEAVRRVAEGYSNLEYDLVAGGRGRRDDHARRSLTALTGAEDAIAVNNNAAAILLVLAALCRDREVIVSRGELIEIGGEFRIPDVIASSGARLIEVGTTNRTRLEDYEKAITPESAAILKVHPSNYRVIGFTAEAPARELAKLARGRGLLMLHDLGSGLIRRPTGWSGDEPEVQASIEEGCDIVTFSGDKLLGGPQAGVIAGRARLIEVIGRHPLMRALRLDKMTIAALEATLAAHIEQRPQDLPLWSMASTPVADLEARAEAIVANLQQLSGGIKIEVVAASAVTGGGSLPGIDLPSVAISIIHPERSASEIQRSLRRARPPVIARIESERVLLDLRTILPVQDELVRRALAAVLA